MTNTKTPLKFPLRPATIVNAALKAEAGTQEQLLRTLEGDRERLKDTRVAYAVHHAGKTKLGIAVLQNNVEGWETETCFDSYGWRKGRAVWVRFEKGENSFRVEIMAKTNLRQLARQTALIETLGEKIDEARRAVRNIAENQRASKDWVTTILQADPEAAEKIAVILRGALGKYSAA